MKCAHSRLTKACANSSLECHVVGESLAGIREARGLSPVEVAGLDLEVRVGHLQLARRILDQLDPVAVERRASLRARAREEGREAPEILALPPLGRVIVAASAVDPLAQEDPRRARRQLGGRRSAIERGEGEGNRRVLLIVARGRDQLARDVLPGAIVRPDFLEVSVKRRNADLGRSRLLEAEIEQDAEPRVGKEARGFVRRQQLIDLARAVGRLLERADLVGVRRPPEDVERDAAQELVVRRARCRSDLLLAPARLEVGVDRVRPRLVGPRASTPGQRREGHERRAGDRREGREPGQRPRAHERHGSLLTRAYMRPARVVSAART